MTKIRLAVAVCFIALAACGDDEEADQSTTIDPAVDEDAGPHHGEAGKNSTTPDMAGSGGAKPPSSGTAGNGGSTAPPNPGGSGGSPAAGSGGAKPSDPPKAGEGGSPAEAGRAGSATAGRGGPSAGRGGPAAGRGGRAGSGPGQDQCPASAPENGSACEGIQGLSCEYGETTCRCRRSEPVWLCENGDDAPEAGRGEAGSGGRPGRGNQGEGGRGRGRGN